MREAVATVTVDAKDGSVLGGTLTEEEGGVLAYPAVATVGDAGESGCDGCMEEMSRDSWYW